jgi:glycosyltransferase involved in cell wall biosynthesis
VATSRSSPEPTEGPGPDDALRSAAAGERPAADERPGRPLVSVCISAYDVERYLRESIESVLAQSYRQLEVIVVDNGSSDGTYDVARAIDDERFRCFRLEENIGGYQAMNMVASMARGDFVAIYHPDDVYDPTIVEKEVAYLEAHPEAGAVFTMYHFMDEGGTVYDGRDVPAELAGREHVTYDDAFPAMLRHGNMMFAWPTFMIRREVLLDVGPFDAERWDIAADLEFVLRLARRYPLGILDERLLRYRQTPNQWTRRWKRLRTDPDRTIEVMELFLEQDGSRSPLAREELLELRYLRCDDETTRAANTLILGDAATARRLLKGRYPYAVLLDRFRRRKLRVLLLRGLMKAGLTLRAGRPLGRLLRGTEYGEWR